MGAPDIQMDSHGNINFRLSQQLQWHAKQDALPEQVKPVPITVVNVVLHHAHISDDMEDDLLAIANMTCIRFFFL